MPPPPKPQNSRRRGQKQTSSPNQNTEKQRANLVPTNVKLHNWRLLKECPDSTTTSIEDEPKSGAWPRNWKKRRRSKTGEMKTTMPDPGKPTANRQDIGKETVPAGQNAGLTLNNQQKEKMGANTPLHRVRIFSQQRGGTHGGIEKGARPLQLPLCAGLLRHPLEQRARNRSHHPRSNQISTQKNHRLELYGCCYDLCLQLSRIWMLVWNLNNLKICLVCYRIGRFISTEARYEPLIWPVVCPSVETIAKSEQLLSLQPFTEQRPFLEPIAEQLSKRVKNTEKFTNVCAEETEHSGPSSLTITVEQANYLNNRIRNKPRASTAQTLPSILQLPDETTNLQKKNLSNMNMNLRIGASILLCTLNLDITPYIFTALLHLPIINWVNKANLGLGTVICLSFYDYAMMYMSNLNLSYAEQISKVTSMIKHDLFSGKKDRLNPTQRKEKLELMFLWSMILYCILRRLQLCYCPIYEEMLQLLIQLSSAGNIPRCRSKRNIASQVQKKQTETQQIQNKYIEQIYKQKERGEYILHNTSCDQTRLYSNNDCRPPFQ